MLSHTAQSSSQQKNWDIYAKNPKFLWGFNTPMTKGKQLSIQSYNDLSLQNKIFVSVENSLWSMSI
jgi:hypothetical protein